MRLIDADEFKEDLVKRTEDGLQEALVRGILTKEAEQRIDCTLRGFLMDIDDQPTVDKWINVKDRLPESEGTYLVATKNKKVLTDHFYAKNKVWGGNRLNPLITHWMPLPEPPEE